MINPINSSSQIAFKSYQSPLKTMFKKGQMPSVTRGLYGEKIDPSNVSLEHLKPHSLGGRTDLSNLALADKYANSARGNKPLANFLSKDMVDNYLSQFNFVIPGKFDGYKYQAAVRETCQNLGINVSEPKQINYGNMKEVMANLDQINLKDLPKKVLRSVKNRLKKSGKSLDIFA